MCSSVPCMRLSMSRFTVNGYMPYTGTFCSRNGTALVTASNWQAVARTPGWVRRTALCQARNTSVSWSESGVAR